MNSLNLFIEKVVTKFDTTMQQNRNIQDQVSSHIKTIKTKFESENRAKNLVLFGLKEEDASLNVVDSV